MNRPRKKLGSRFALAAILCGLYACASSVGDIDRTQPNVVRKALFDGVWYARQTVVDVPATARFTFVGMASPLEKITWEIQEDKLVAYRAYQRVDGMERPGERANADVKGNPVAAFPITSHFDITRSYNPQTGEQSNVLSENAADRPWYQRAFMRVDWAKNLVANYEFVSDEVKEMPVSTVPEVEGGDDAFYMEDESGARVTELRHPREIGYFDFTTRVFLEPSLNGCLLSWFGQSTADCTAAEVKIRTAFAKITRESEYESLPYSDKELSKFGFIRTERLAFDRGRGVTESGRIYLANRHNIWEETLVKGADGKPIDVCPSMFAASRPAGALDLGKVDSFVPDASGRVRVACAAADGSAEPCGDADVVALYQTGCSTSERIRVRIPMTLRTPRPIVYHLSPLHPVDLIPAVERAARRWSAAFRRAVALATSRDIADLLLPKSVA